MPLPFTKVERVTFAEDRQREALFWASKTIEERVLAGWALADDNLISFQEHEPEDRTAIVFRRIERRRR